MKKLTIAIISLIFFWGVAFVGNDVDAQIRPYRVSDSAIKVLLTRIESRTDVYKRRVDSALDRSRYNDTDTEDDLMAYITEFENATDQLKQRFDAKRSVNSDVTNVLNRATFINKFMLRNNLTRRSEQTWRLIKQDLDTLARYYSVSYDWNAAVSTGGSVYVKPYRVSDATVKTLFARIESQTDVYKRRMNSALDRSTLNDTNKEDEIFRYITDFENATDELKRNFDSKKSVDADVTNVLTRAASINYFMVNNNLSRNAENSWTTLKAELDVLADYYNVAFNWTNRVPIANEALAYIVAGSKVQTLLSSIETKSDNFKRSVNTALDRSVLNNTRSEDTIFAYITEFENATDRLKQRFDAKESTDGNVNEVLDRAAFIDSFMRDYRLMRSAENDWRSVKTDLNLLASYYGVGFNWDRKYEPVSKFDSMLTGTYRLNVVQSDPVATVVRNSIEIYPQYKENQIERQLTRRLASPEMIAIQKRGNEVTVASNIAPQIIFSADGVARNELNARGQNVKITAQTYYDGVALSYEGDRLNDFYVNFMPISDNKLRVVRRVNLEGVNESVTVASVYDKIENVAQFETLKNAKAQVYSVNDGDGNGFVIPNGTQLKAEMRSTVSTKASQNGDRFTMEVVSPSQYQGAIIEGHVITAERSGVLSGRANVSLDFDTIRLRNGRTYKFAGIIDNVTLASGENVTVDNEGQVKDNNQTSKTVKRAGIGAGVGAILGAILGGGDGAAIGAAIGAGAGAGTVIAQGRDDVELEQGSSVSITASSPVSVSNQR